MPAPANIGAMNRGGRRSCSRRALPATPASARDASATKEDAAARRGDEYRASSWRVRQMPPDWMSPELVPLRQHQRQFPPCCETIQECRLIARGQTRARASEKQLRPPTVLQLHNSEEWHGRARSNL